MDYLNKKLAIFMTPDEALKLEADMTPQTNWASLDQMPQLFGLNKSVIYIHITTILKKINKRESTVAKKSTTITLVPKTYQINNNDRG